MAEICIKNDYYIIKAKTSGAELCSVFAKELGKELLWQAKPEIWARHAPVLFPIVGKLKNDSYTYEEHSYQLPQHGFARDMDFGVENVSPQSVTFLLTSNEQTKQNFPCDFELRIRYILKEKKVSCEYEVINAGQEKMYFSIGAHPGFICPMYEGEKLSDYTIGFEQQETAQRQLLQNGLFDGRQEDVMDVNKINLSSTLFEKDAIVFKNLKSSSLEMHSDKYVLYFSWYNMPYFGIWTKKGCEEFICLEPWAGLADSTNASGDIKQKEGVIALPSNQNYTCGFAFSV